MEISPKKARKEVGLVSGLCLLYALVMFLVQIFWALGLAVQQALAFPENPDQIPQRVDEILKRSSAPELLGLTIGIFIFWLYRDHKLFKEDLRQTRVMDVKTFLILLSLLLLPQLSFTFLNLGLESLLNLFGLSMQAAAEAASAQSSSLTMFLYVAIFGPISEELIFRGAILRGLEPYGRVFAIVFSSFLFGIFHANLVQSIFAFFVGLIFAYVSLEYSLIWSICLHIFNNLVLGEGLSYLDSLAPGLAEPVSLTLMGLGSLFALFFLYKNRASLTAYLAGNPTPKGFYRAGFQSVMLWIFILLALYTSLQFISSL